MSCSTKYSYIILIICHILHSTPQGPVRVIVRLTLDRDYFDHETKAAAEQILVNIGFRDGLSDLEVPWDTYIYMYTYISFIQKLILI